MAMARSPPQRALLPRATISLAVISTPEEILAQIANTRRGRWGSKIRRAVAPRYFAERERDAEAPRGRASADGTLESVVRRSCRAPGAVACARGPVRMGDLTGRKRRHAGRLCLVASPRLTPSATSCACATRPLSLVGARVVIATPMARRVVPAAGRSAGRSRTPCNAATARPRFRPITRRARWPLGASAGSCRCARRAIVNSDWVKYRRA